MNTTSSDQSTPVITREEYKMMKSVFDRLGVSDIFDEIDFFSNLYTTSFTKFFTSQPLAIMALSIAASTTSGFPCEKINDFVDSLSHINGFIQEIYGAYDILVEVDKLCEAMDEARIAYK